MSIEELYSDLDQRKLVGIILELTIENIDLKKQLSIHGVSICLERAKKYARHQHFLGTQGKELVEFDDWKAKD